MFFVVITGACLLLAVITHGMINYGVQVVK
jgi:hypothetical protein